MQTSSISVTIDERLRYTLFGIQSIMGISFNVKELERIFSDSHSGQVSEKSYDIFKGRRKKVFGKVDEYEPETITISVLYPNIDQKKLEEIYEEASMVVFRKMKQDNQSVFTTP